MQDLARASDAVAYISSLCLNDAASSVRDYGHELMSAAPAETTELLTKLCTCYEPTPHQPLQLETDEGLGWGHQRSHAPLHRNMTAPAILSTTYATSKAPAGLVNQAEDEGGGAGGGRLDASEFMGIFGDDDKHMMLFLESVIQHDKNAPKRVYDTLLELYISRTDKSYNDGETDNKRTKRVLELMRGYPERFDSGHVLMLCRLHGFPEGMLVLYEQTGLFREVVQHHMSRGDAAQVGFTACFLLSVRVA